MPVEVQLGDGFAIASNGIRCIFSRSGGLIGSKQTLHRLFMLEIVVTNPYTVHARCGVDCIR